MISKQALVLSGIILCAGLAMPAVSAQTAAPPHAAELAPIAWIAGTWIGHQGAPSPSGADIIMDVRWAPNGRALLMDLTSVRGEDKQPYMSAIYYWHPGSRAITMWQILASGAVNDGRVVTATTEGLLQELQTTELTGAVRLVRTEFVRNGEAAFQFEAKSRSTAADPWVPGASIRFVRQH